MDKTKVDYTLYMCTDRDLMSTKTVEESVEKAIKGGVTVIQLREKNISSREFYEVALKVKDVTDRYNVPLIIDDRVDIALAVDADGVHVGQSDLDAAVVRRLLGKDKIIGVTAKSVEQAKAAEEAGADYLGVGAMFSTSTKADAKATNFDELDNIRKSVDIPIVAIGGITKENLVNLKNRDLNGIAVISAIVAKEDVEAAAREIYQAFTL